MSPPFMRIPFRAPLPVPTMIAVGVARPRAHGHAMTSTATATMTAKEISSRNITYHVINVRRAITMTIGTKYAETMSANRWIGAFRTCASSISLMIWLSVVFFPTFVALKIMLPFLFIVPPTT